MFAGHDAFVTIGERIGEPDCTIPTCGLDWITTPQPVVLEQWPAQRRRPRGAVHVGRELARPVRARSSTRATTYGLRVHEFRRFAELPRRTRERFEVALDIDEAETADLELLRANGWRLADPRGRGRRPVGLPGLRAGLEGGADGRQGHVRRRAAAAGSAIAASATSPAAGRWSRRTPASPSCIRPGEGLLAFADLDGARRRGRGGRRRLRAPRAGRPGAGRGALRLATGSCGGS